MLTGIVVALPEEISTLTNDRIVKGGWFRMSDSLLVSCSGVGPENARLAAEMLINHGVTRLLSWGCAAALNETLKPGDLVITDTLVDTEFSRFELNPDELNKTLNLLQEHLVIYCGTLAETKNIVSASTDKKQIHANTGADILDMESVAIAKVAKQHNLSFLAIRAVADPVTMNLPKAISYAIDSEGEVVLSKLLYFLLLHPSELPELIKLGRYFHSAKNKLKQVAKYLDTIASV